MDSRLLASSAALNEGRKSDAADLIINYLTDTGEAPRNVYSALISLLIELRRVADGLLWSQRAVESAPRDADIINLRGILLRMAGRPADAIPLFDQAIRLRPADIAAQINKGQCYNDLKNGKAAEPIFTKLLRQHPRDPRLYRALARSLSVQGKLGAAEARLRQLLALDNRDIDAWLDLSAAAADRADYAAALAVLDHALQVGPDNERLLRAKLVILKLSADMPALKAFLADLLSRHDDKAWIPHELASLVSKDDREQAIALLRRACQLSPKNRIYRLDFVQQLLLHRTKPEGKNLDDARALLSTVPLGEERTLHEIGIRHAAHILTADVEAEGQLGDLDFFSRLLVAAGDNGSFLNLLPQVKSLADRHVLIDRHRQIGDQIIAGARQAPVTIAARPASSSRIRIGFMSSDLRAHPVTYFAWPLFEHADRERFEIFCYSWYEGAEADHVQHRLSSMVDHFRWHPSIDDREAAQLIADDSLDILFEMGGMTAMNKLNVMAWKPARLCASWLGYPHSAGFDTIDYLLVDPFINPPDPDLLIEKPLVMPRSWIAMSDKAFVDDMKIDPVAPHVRNGRITFGTANNPYKYNRAMMQTWARTVARVPGSRFIIVRPEAGSQTFQHNIRKAFLAEGVSGDRIEFRAVRGAHMPEYNDIDITLDTFPQTGGTTTCEALWMGVPTVTLIGDALFERLSYSVLSNADLSDLCARTTDEFIDIAVSLAEDRERIQQLRTGLRDQLRAGPLGQTRQFAEDFYDLVASTIDEHANAAL